MVKGKVLTQGFLTDVDVPSEERLAIHIDLSGLEGYRHVDWVSALQDLLRGVDASYRNTKNSKNNRGEPRKSRSVRVRYVKDVSGLQRKVATFHPYPSALVNRLKEMRHKVYDALNENCLILQEERIGRMKRKLYFLPSSLAPEFMLEVEELNRKLAVLVAELKAFEGSADFSQIMKHIEAAGVKPDGFSANLTPIRVSPVPLSLSKEFFTQYLEEEKRKMLTEVDEKRKEGLAVLEREMQRKREEMLEALKRNLQDRFATVMAMAEEAVKATISGRGASSVAATKRMKELSRLIKSVGIEFDEKPFDALGDVFSAVNSKDAEMLKNAVNELAESLGVKPSGDPVRDMELASRTVRGKSVMLFTID